MSKEAAVTFYCFIIRTNGVRDNSSVHHLYEVTHTQLCICSPFLHILHLFVDLLVHVWEISALSFSFHSLDMSQRRGCAFGKWLCIMSWWRMVIPIRRDHLGPTASANHQVTSSPQAENSGIFTLQGRKWRLKLHFVRVSSWMSPFQNITPDSYLQWQTQLWRGGNLLKQNTEANVMLYVRRWRLYKPSPLQCHLCLIGCN